MKDSTPDNTRKRLHKLAWFLDSSLRIPGTNFSIGLDAIIGLIPGVGDFVGAIFSSYILREAARLGTPKTLIFRMVFNIVVELLVGMIPLVGDIFDMTWKANLRNVRLLESYKEQPSATTASNRYFSVMIVIFLILVTVIISMLSLLILRWFWSAITA